MTTLIYIAFGLMTVAAIISLCELRRLAKALRCVRDNYDGLLRDYNKLYLACDFTPFSKAKVEENADSPVCPYFSVYCEGAGKKLMIRNYYYNPDDPDDRDYKRIHAEEVAEKIKENP